MINDYEFGAINGFGLIPLWGFYLMHSQEEPITN